MFRRRNAKKHPGQSASSKAADAILEETKLQMDLKRKQCEREEIEHELRVKLLKTQIEVQEKMSQVQDKILEMLNNNPEKLNIKF